MMITGMEHDGVWWHLGDRVRSKRSGRVGTIADINHDFRGRERLPNRITVDFDDDDPTLDKEDDLTIHDLEIENPLDKLARDWSR